ncbi:MAG: serine/threonine-protein kinase [Deltaproteobacteria bacterium]|nr:serine/threonine-protein kinase [Deltaproteobacteria bacterium]
MSEGDSLAGLMGTGQDAGGVEAEAALARLRRTMFKAAPATVRLGKYEGLEEIGRGGMSVVYRAHDQELGRDVALKLLRADTPGDTARLRREAQAMARLSHPHVVQVLEVGQERGETFVVMELVEGRDAARWLEQQQPAWPAIVQAFIAAGRGLAAAHDQGLVHRDFKPSNVMVGDDGRVRVTDFGLAATDRSATTIPTVAREHTDDDADPTTAAGSRVGPPRYMAPEQRHGQPIDHRADQWSFAVSLWEAVHGRHPFADAQGIIDPARPAPTTPPSSAVPGSLRRVLTRALRHQPTQRYPSMEALLERLSSLGGRRRRRIAVGLVAMGAVGLVAAALPGTTSAPPLCDPSEHIAKTWGAQRQATLTTTFDGLGLPYATRAWSDARARLDAWMDGWQARYRDTCAAPTAVDHDLQLACLRGDLVEVDALLDVFEAADRTLVPRIDRAVRGLPRPERCATPKARYAGIDPQVLKAHAGRMGQTRAQLRAGRYTRAAELAEVARDAVTEHPALHREARMVVGSNLRRAGGIEAADEVLRPVFYEAAAAEDVQLAAQAALGLLVLAIRRSEHEDAIGWERHAETWSERIEDPDKRREFTLDRISSAAERLSDQGRYDEALVQLERAWALCDHDENHTQAPRLFNQMGLVQIELSAYDEAEKILLRAIEVESRHAGRAHPQVANSITNLGNVYWFRAQYDQAESAYQEAYDIRREWLGPTNAKTAITVMNLGLIADIRGDLPRAIELLEEAVASLTEARGLEHPETAQAIGNLASTVSRTGDHERSNREHSKALEIYEKVLGPHHPKVAHELQNLAAGYSEVGRLEDARTLYTRALEIVEKAHGSDHVLYAHTQHNLAVTLRRLDEYAEAETRDRAALAIYEKRMGVEHPNVARVLVGLAQNALDAKQFEQAVALAGRARSIETHQAWVRGLAAFFLAQGRVGVEPGRARGELLALLDEADREFRAEGKNGADNLEDLLRWRKRNGY